MSFATSENSESGGRPVFLAKFFRTGKAWFHTNADQDILFNGDMYLAVPMKLSSFVQAGTSTPEDQKITLPRSAPLCQYLDLLVPSSTINVHIRKIHMTENSTDGTFAAPSLADAPIYWIGSIAGIARPSPSVRELSCIALSLSRGGLRMSWSSGCGHMLYEHGCRVDKTAFAWPIAAVTVVSGIEISSSDFATKPDGWFSGGFITWESEPGVVEKRGIEEHVGNTITMFGDTNGVAGGDNYVAYPGCQRIPTVCDTKFNNMVNYGGINHLEGRSPFDGNPVF